MTKQSNTRPDRASDRTQQRPTKGGNRARPRPLERQVRGGRIRKNHHLNVSDESTNEVRKTTHDVPEETNDDLPLETITSDEDHEAYQDSAETDDDSSEEFSSATEKDTPTRIAVERQQQHRSKLRAMITTRPLVRSRDPIRPGRNDSTSGPSSISHRSSSIGLRTPLLPLSSEIRFTSTEGSSPGPVAANTPPLNKDWANLPSRKNMVTGRERVLLEAARVQVLRFTLFTDPFPSAASLTSYIHTAWEETEKQFLTNVEVSPESLAHVSAGKTRYIHEGMLIVV